MSACSPLLFVESVRANLCLLWTALGFAEPTDELDLAVVVIGLLEVSERTILFKAFSVSCGLHPVGTFQATRRSSLVSHCLVEQINTFAFALELLSYCSDRGCTAIAMHGTLLLPPAAVP